MTYMKQLLWLLLLLICLGAGRLSAQTTSFNFSSAPRAASGWINVYGNPALASTPITATDPSTGITISSVAAANWAGLGAGHTTSADGGGAAGGTFFPAAVMMNEWFQYGDYLAVYNAVVPQLEIRGLNKDSVYTLKMTGSFSLNVPNTYNLNPTRYTVAGAVLYGYRDVNGNFNTADGAVFTNISPDTNGKIRVYVNTYNGSNLAGISGLQIIRGSSSSPTPNVTITHPMNNDVLVEDGNFVFSATASETNGTITKVQFYINDTKMGEDSTAPYAYTWVNPDEGHYTLMARAFDSQGNSSSASINVSVESLSSFWSMTGNIAANADSNFVGTVDTNRLAFRTNNLERMSILGDGSVGIGTKNTYGYKLAVNGSAIFTKVKVKTAGTWPDYVFDKGYKLPDLASLERYLAEHKHLPEITPAAEAEREGIDVAAQQAALLKKVEELTLYLIEENKQLKAQLKKNAEQNTRIQQLEQQLNTLEKLIRREK